MLPFKWVRVSGDHAYISGHGPLDGSRGAGAREGGRRRHARSAANEAARLTALSILASLKHELGDLDRVTGWVKALGLVNCAPGFSGTPGVINGFSDLVIDLWGEPGATRARRSARLSCRSRCPSK